MVSIAFRGYTVHINKWNRPQMVLSLYYALELEELYLLNDINIRVPYMYIY